MVQNKVALFTCTCKGDAIFYDWEKRTRKTTRKKMNKEQRKTWTPETYSFEKAMAIVHDRV